MYYNDDLYNDDFSAWYATSQTKKKKIHCICLN